MTARFFVHLIAEHPDPSRQAHGLRVASGPMSDKPIKQTTNSAIVGGAGGHRVPIAGTQEPAPFAGSGYIIATAIAC
jgi:hypothetical protein